MEELRSTEALDREILEDARKKAFKILKSADETLESQTKRWNKKTAKALLDSQKSYAARLEKVKEEIFARLPLDKRRLRSKTAEKSLTQAMEVFLHGLNREQLLAVLDREFAARLAACIDWTDGGSQNPALPGVKAEEAVLSYSGLSETEAGIALQKALGFIPKGFDGNNIKLKKNESSLASAFPALSLQTDTVWISASVEEAAFYLLETRRAELAAALLGGGVLDD
ncbi:MAG: ATPase [Treponema sp.]|jgi:hypothetical protein|nr:ATPase [Treponema sp.]